MIATLEFLRDNFSNLMRAGFVAGLAVVAGALFFTAWMAVTE